MCLQLDSNLYFWFQVKIRIDWLQKAEEMKELTLSECREEFAGTLANIDKSQICTKNAKFSYACQGKL